MMTIPFTGILALLLSATFATCTSSPPGDSLKWSSHYFAEGNIIIPLADVSEPFRAWFDSESNNSRIDYYDGMTKIYQSSNDTSEYDASYYRVVPVAKTITENIVECLKTPYGKFQSSVQTILPDLRNFTFHSERVEEDRTVEKWIYRTTERNVDNTYEMLLYKKDNVIYPVRFEINGFNPIFRSHVDHYIIEYKNFSVIKPDLTIFYVEEDNCTYWPLSSADHVYHFNPMKEFVQNYGDHVDSSFDQFKRHHNKNYTDGTLEHFKRKNNFRQNMRFIHSKNRANVGYELAVNHFADRSSEELASMLGCSKTDYSEYDAGRDAPFSGNELGDPPSEVNWWTAGAVNPVRDQGLCGSCWSFGAVGALEGAYFLKYGKRVRFSEQALVDCSWEYNNFGCGGGSDVSSYKWVKKHGIPTAEQYGPYLSMDGYCHMANLSSANLTKISTYKTLVFTDEKTLQHALFNHGPISVHINASPKSFAFYSNGVYHDEECVMGYNTFKLNHLVLLVGYGTLHGEPYWLLKNSWSPVWGNDGYILVSRKSNMCGVLCYATYVVF